MPIKSCTLPGGGSGYRWGDEGKCYPTREEAAKQARAAYANGYTGDAMPDDLPDVHFGEVEEDKKKRKHSDWRGLYGSGEVEDEDPDDEEKGWTDDDVVSMLGFDPKEEAAEAPATSP